MKAITTWLLAQGEGGVLAVRSDTKDPLSPGLHPSYREQLMNWEKGGWQPQATILNLKTGSILDFSRHLPSDEDIELAC